MDSITHPGIVKYVEHSNTSTSDGSVRAGCRFVGGQKEHAVHQGDRLDDGEGHDYSATRHKSRLDANKVEGSKRANSSCLGKLLLQRHACCVSRLSPMAVSQRT